MKDRAGDVLNDGEAAARLTDGPPVTERIEPRATEPLPAAGDTFPREPRIGGRFGNYEILAKIGEGAMGTVYRLRHQFFEREAALKVLRPHLSSDGNLVRRFLNEARAANAIKHPHIIEVVDTGLLPDGSAPYLLMELLVGESLRQRMRRLGRIELHSALHITRQVASALGATHDQGIIHRDLKPENLFLVARDGRDDVVKVLDFGVAKLGAELAGRDVATQPGVVVGTPRYMSPEQCRGVEAADHRADIYALGVILYEMLAGEPPFDANAVGALLEMQLLREPVSLREHAPSTPPAVVAAVMRAIARRPEDRFASTRELAAALEDVGDVAAAAHAPLAAKAAPDAANTDTDSFGPATLSRDREASAKRGARTRLLLPLAGAAVAALGLALFAGSKPARPPLVTPAVAPVVAPAPVVERAPPAPAAAAPAVAPADVGAPSPSPTKKRGRARKAKYVPPLWW